MAKHVLTLPIRKPLLSSNDQRRAHWTTVAKAKGEVELLVTHAIQKAKLKTLTPPVTVQLIWYAPDARRRDVDGLGPMIKACLDAIVKKGLLPDDNSQIVQHVQLGPVIISRDNPRMEIHIQELEG